jgi:hypothetical protein
MESKLSKILSSLTILAAWAYSLGWIKTLYYFRAFGIGLESVEYSVQDYLFASWYVVENILFFLLLLCLAAIVRRTWVYLIVLLYLPLPLLTEASYSHLNWAICRWFVDVPHSVLKFVPFVVLLLAIWIHPDARPWFRKPFERLKDFPLVLVLIVAVAWSISAAKHFGASEAKNVLRNPEGSLLRVKLDIAEAGPELKPLETRQSLYLLYLSPHRCILLDTAGFVFGQPGAHVSVLFVPPEKVELVDGLRKVQMNPGRLFW